MAGARPTEPVFARVPIELIDAGTNVRVDETGLDALADSIRKHGVLQPITVVPSDTEGRVRCLFGHRRLAAARLAGLTHMPCLARPRDTPATEVLTQIAENRDRKRMSPLEEGLAYRRLRDLGMTQQQIASAVGTTQPSVSERLLLLEYPEAIQRAVHARKIGVSDALAIPVELARVTDGRTLTAVCRRGGRHVRGWVRQQLADAAARGERIKKRTRYESCNIDADLMDAVKAAADREGVKVVEWLRRAVRERLAVQAAARTDAA